MVGYYKTNVVEIAIAVGIGMTAWRDTLRVGVNQGGNNEFAVLRVQV